MSKEFKNDFAMILLSLTVKNQATLSVILKNQVRLLSQNGGTSAEQLEKEFSSAVAKEEKRILENFEEHYVVDLIDKDFLKPLGL